MYVTLNSSKSNDMSHQTGTFLGTSISFWCGDQVGGEPNARPWKGFFIDWCSFQIGVQVLPRAGSHICSIIVVHWRSLWMPRPPTSRSCPPSNCSTFCTWWVSHKFGGRFTPGESGLPMMGQGNNKDTRLVALHAGVIGENGLAILITATPPVPFNLERITAGPTAPGSSEYHSG